MANNHYLSLSTCLALDSNEPAHKPYIEIFTALGSSAKTFVKVMLLHKYGHSVEMNEDEKGRRTAKVVNPDYQQIVDKYFKPHIKKSESEYVDSAVFFNWLKTDENDMDCLRLLIPLEGGVQDFILDELKDYYPHLFDPNPLPQLLKKVKPETKKKEFEASSVPKQKKTSTVPSPAPAQAQPKPVQETQELDDEEKALLELANDFTSAMDGSTKVNDNASTDSTSDTYTDELGFRFKKKG